MSVGEQTNGSRPVVSVVACGGTIASQRSTTGGIGARPVLTGQDLVAMVPELDAVATIETHTYSVKASSDLEVDDILGLHRLLCEQSAQHPDIAGFVITHGTDTMEEVAFGLSLLWDDPRPVVLTGAMRHASLPGADGPANLLDAVVTAASDAARGRGVLVVLNAEVHSPRLVRKLHASNVATFGSPGFGPIGLVNENRLRLPLSVAPGPFIAAPATTVEHPVALLKFGLGDDGRLLAAAADAGYRGAVIEALGGGHLPGRVATSEALRCVVDAMPVVLASRTGGGAVLRSTYSGWDGCETDLLGRGLIGAGTLDGPHARILLTLLLAGGSDRASIDTVFRSFDA